ncbi:MAG: Crp/Fnr family transcriptional regulator, partial [Chloroflexi bacterium]|nr:Crp/Fnr family transcriptional regulator [Chloroflexota bacterium]
DGVYFVVEGRLRAIKSSLQGREQIITESVAGEPIYLVAALDGRPLPVTTQAATRATLLRLSLADFVALLSAQPEVARRLLTTLARRLRQLTTLVEALSLMSVPQRLARLLVERAEAPDGSRMTQREMAAQLGSVREVVARALGQFAERGWLRLGRGSIEILDLQALRDIASGELV